MVMIHRHFSLDFLE